MQTASNDKGETLVLVGSEWKPAANIASDKDGTKAYLVDNQWVIDKEPSTTDKLKSLGVAAAKGAMFGPLGGQIAIMSEGGKALENYAYKTGGKVTDALVGKVAPETAAGAGFLANVGMQAVPTVAAGNMVGGVSKVMDALSKKWMQQAVKPSQFDLRTGAAERGIETMLKEGISPTPGGMDKAHKIVRDAESRVDAGIKASSAKVPMEDVTKPVQGVREKFTNSSEWQDDLAAIEKAVTGFKTNPKFAELGTKEQELAKAVEAAKAARISALQDAGRFKTFGAQQENLAHGGRIQLSPNQTPNTPYFNVGATGGSTVSPSAYPIPGIAPRVAGRYTENVQRVPEANSAVADALLIAKQRTGDITASEKALADHMAAGGSGIPVQLAQDMKKGIYRVLKGKYGELGSASEEAQKAIAHGLRTEVGKAVPSIGPALEREGQVMNAISVALNRAGMSGNKDTLGLSALGNNYAAAIAHLADRSTAIKAMLARALYSGQNEVPSTIARIAAAMAARKQGYEE